MWKKEIQLKYTKALNNQDLRGWFNRHVFVSIWRIAGLKVVDVHLLKPFRLFCGSEGKIVFSGENVMFLFVTIPPRAEIPMHSHRHEQMGICLKGKAEFRTETEKTTVTEGMFYWFKPNEKHSVVSLTDEPSLFLDVFNPPCQDYLDAEAVDSEAVGI